MIHDFNKVILYTHKLFLSFYSAYGEHRLRPQGNAFAQNQWNALMCTLHVVLRNKLSDLERSCWAVPFVYCD